MEKADTLRGSCPIKVVNFRRRVIEVMGIKRIVSFISILFLMNLEVHAATVLGKVAVYTNTDKVEVVPLISGNKISSGFKTLVKVSGGTLVTDKGTVYQAFDEGDKITFQIERGNVYLRIAPEKGRIAFKTSQGEISSPRVVPASTSVVSGEVIVGSAQTIIQVNEGSLDVSPSENVKSITKYIDGKSEKITPNNGAIRLAEGQKIVLAQAEIGAEGGVELASLIDKTGVAKGALNPSGLVEIDGKTYSAVIVDRNLKAKMGNYPSGTQVRVVGTRDNLLLVRVVEAGVGEALLWSGAALIPYFAGATLACILPRHPRWSGLIVCGNSDDDEASPILP